MILALLLMSGVHTRRESAAVSVMAGFVLPVTTETHVVVPGAAQTFNYIVYYIVFNITSRATHGCAFVELII